MAGDVTDTDKGWDKITMSLKDLDGAFTKVGVQQGEKHTSEDGKLSDLVVIAAANEFGTKHIPARPAHKQAFDKNKDRLSILKANLYGKIVTRKISVNRALWTLGEFMQAQIQRQITRLRSPANAPTTIKAKGSNNPLIDTGHYRNSIKHVEVS